VSWKVALTAELFGGSSGLVLINLSKHGRTIEKSP